MKLLQTWDLETIFPGGSASSRFRTACEEVEAKFPALEEFLRQRKLSKAIALSQKLNLQLREMTSFVSCLIAQNVQDSGAYLLDDRIKLLQATFDTLMTLLGESLKKLSGQDFDKLVAAHRELAFFLRERRALSQKRLKFEQEAMIGDFKTDGYHGWSKVWFSFVGEMRFPYEGEELSFGQIESKVASSERAVRCKAFETISFQFKRYRSLFAHILNHLSGFRLEIYRQRRWKNWFREILEEHRIEQAGLDMMWRVIGDNRAPLYEYLRCKAALLKIKNQRLSWYDLEAPLYAVDRHLSYEEVAMDIVAHFKRLSPKMAAFTKEQVLKGRWIESENRPGKGAGGFCAPFPLKGESRIFMTYSDTRRGSCTLAHELGHAFHNSVLFPLPAEAHYPAQHMAETASTMAELIVTKGAIEGEQDPKMRLYLLDNYLSRAVECLLNIYARFLFETLFYEERQGGVVSHERLSALMEEAQKRAYGGVLASYHPLFWATKMHFYLSETPFYNFPYTFGYLFSLSIYTMFREDVNFESRYIALLKDMGLMNTEELLRTHLQIDLHTPVLWRRALDSIKQDVQNFLDLAKQYL